MEAKKGFGIGNLVWAKMKGYPFWPGKIVRSPGNARSNLKKAHYVFFFGTENYALIQDKNIIHHSKEMLDSTYAKNKSSRLKVAMEKIALKAARKTKSLNNEKGSSKISSKVSTSVTERKNTKAQRINITVKNLKVQKKIAPKRHVLDKSRNEKSPPPKFAPKWLVLDKSANERSPPKFASKRRVSIKPENERSSPKLASKHRVSMKLENEIFPPPKCALIRRVLSKSAFGRDPPFKVAPEQCDLGESVNERFPPPGTSRKIEDFSELINNTPPNINYNRVAVIRPLDEHANNLTSSGIARCDYSELQPSPALNLYEPNEAVEEKNIRPINKKIGFIGLGMIGQRLVKNLLTTGHNVTIWNRTPEKCEDFVNFGVAVAQSPADLIEKCDIIFSCVSGPEASKSLVYGHDGILTGLENSPFGSKGYVELTSMDTPTSKLISESVTIKGGRYLEAPFVGSRRLAEDGSVIILAAGDSELFTICHSCLFAFSNNVHFLGPKIGSGSGMNHALRMFMGVTNAALAESMVLVERCHLSLNNFLEILELVPLCGPTTVDKGHDMQLRIFAPDTTLKYLQKDINFALLLGNDCNQPMPVATAANELYKKARRLFYADHDMSAIIMGAKY